ncbi:MAG: molybdopterin molybdenumtransferase MoeA, partial [Bacillota bacterium]
MDRDERGAGRAAAGGGAARPERGTGPRPPAFRRPFPAGELPTVEEARRRILAAVGHPPVEAEEVALDEALGRVLVKPVYAGDDVPGFHRSTVDGYAVRSDDLRGAGPGRPVRLRLVGEGGTGRPATARVGPGRGVAGPQGGRLPRAP